MNHDRTNKYAKYRTLTLALSMLAAVGVSAPAMADHDCGPEQGHQHHGGNFFKQHETQLHDELQLTGAQGAAWNTFIAKMGAGEHGNKEKHDWAEQSGMTTPERMDHMLAIMKARLDKMEFRAHAIEEFYAQLTPAQQQTFDNFVHSFRGQHKPH